MIRAFIFVYFTFVAYLNFEVHTHVLGWLCIIYMAIILPAPETHMAIWRQVARLPALIKWLLQPDWMDAGTTAKIAITVRPPYVCIDSGGRHMPSSTAEAEEMLENEFNGQLDTPLLRLQIKHRAEEYARHIGWLYQEGNLP